MEKRVFDQLKEKAIRRGLPNWYYEPIDEPLTDRDAWNALPEYYRATVEEKNAKVNRILKEHPEYEAFVFFSDAHVRQNRMSSVPIIRSILANTPVKDVFYGGDTVSAWITGESMREDMRYFADAFAFADLYTVRGNHDADGKPFEYSDVGYIAPTEEVRKWVIQDGRKGVTVPAGKTYYYFDHPKARMRYIVIDTNEQMEHGVTPEETWDCLVEVSGEQFCWFSSVLRETPAEYRIAVLGHIPFFPELKWSKSMVFPFGDMVEAFNRKESVAVLAGNEQYAFDFSGTEGKVILTLCGHGHCDDVYVSPSGCINYEINCDSWINNGGSPYERVPGTVSENALDVILLDPAGGRMETVRYGAGEDRIVRAEAQNLEK